MGKTVNRRDTICETLRTINDLHQDGTEHSEEVRVLLAKATDMAKRMVRKLEEYKEGTKKEIFTGKTQNVKAKRKFRRSEGYKKI